MRWMQREEKKGNVMTPEAARDLGKRTTKEIVVDLMDEVYDPSITDLIDAVEIDLSERVNAAEILYEHVPIALRGSAAYFRELADEADERAAVLEATR